MLHLFRYEIIALLSSPELEKLYVRSTFHIRAIVRCETAYLVHSELWKKIVCKPSNLSCVTLYVRRLTLNWREAGRPLSLLQRCWNLFLQQLSWKALDQLLWQAGDAYCTSSDLLYRTFLCTTETDLTWQRKTVKNSAKNKLSNIYLVLSFHGSTLWNQYVSLFLSYFDSLLLSFNATVRMELIPCFSFKLSVVLLVFDVTRVTSGQSAEKETIS